jgi:hypothetical protein
MNERMLELALQAGLKKEHGADREYMGDFDWREFADLIVRECMDIAKYHTPDTEECEYTWLIHDKIQEYFGVEE